MNSKIIRRVGLGIAAYIIFVLLVVKFYKDDPSKMDWQDREQFNKAEISKLQLGTSKQSIITLLGSPDISEAKMVKGQSIQVMFYRTQRNKSDGLTTQDECVPLLFKDNILIAWGKGTYNQYLGL